MAQVLEWVAREKARLEELAATRNAAEQARLQEEANQAIAILREELAPLLPEGVSVARGIWRKRQTRYAGEPQVEVALKLDLGGIEVNLWRPHGGYRLMDEVSSYLGRSLEAWTADGARKLSSVSSDLNRNSLSEALVAAYDGALAHHKALEEQRQREEEREAYQEKQRQWQKQRDALVAEMQGLLAQAGHDLEVLVDEEDRYDVWRELEVEEPDPWKFVNEGVEAFQAELGEAVAQARWNLGERRRRRNIEADLREQADVLATVNRESTLYKLTFPTAFIVGHEDTHAEYRTEYALESSPDPEGRWGIVDGDSETWLKVVVAHGALVVEPLTIKAGAGALDLPPQLRSRGRLERDGVEVAFLRPSRLLADDTSEA